MEITEFAALAREVQHVGRILGYEVIPSFRSPAKIGNRTITRRSDGCSVAVNIKGRSPEEVRHDLMCGLIAANPVVAARSGSILEALNIPVVPVGGTHAA